MNEKITVLIKKIEAHQQLNALDYLALEECQRLGEKENPLNAFIVGIAAADNEVFYFQGKGDYGLAFDSQPNAFRLADIRDVLDNLPTELRRHIHIEFVYSEYPQRLFSDDDEEYYLYSFCGRDYQDKKDMRYEDNQAHAWY